MRFSGGMPTLATLLVVLLSRTRAVEGQGNRPCLDPNAAQYQCTPGKAAIWMVQCNLTDEDWEDISACLDNVGRSNITGMFLDNNAAITTVPADLLHGLVNMVVSGITGSNIKTLPAELFDQGLDRLAYISLGGNGLTGLPASLFQGLPELAYVLLRDNALTTLPAGIFDGAFQGITTEHPGALWLTSNPDLQCLPYLDETLVHVDLDEGQTLGTCGCSPAEAVMCDSDLFCVPGAAGYTCASEAPSTPAPSTAAPTAAGPTCTGGLSGIENSSKGTCCPVGCGQCGGSGCAQSGLPDYKKEDCCAGRILASEVYCDTPGASAPCIIGSGP